MKKSILFLCVWLVFLGIVGAAKAILYTMADDRDHVLSPESNSDQFGHDMQFGVVGHGSHRKHEIALWDEGRRYRRWVHRGWRGFPRGRHQFRSYAGGSDYELNADGAEAGIPDLGMGSDPDWNEGAIPIVDDIAGYDSAIPSAVTTLNPTTAPESAAPVPEPATLFLVGAGLVGIAALKRKKSVKNK